MKHAAIDLDYPESVTATAETDLGATIQPGQSRELVTHTRMAIATRLKVGCKRYSEQAVGLLAMSFRKTPSAVDEK